jgi:hypothetical protein
MFEEFDQRARRLPPAIAIVAAVDAHDLTCNQIPRPVGCVFEVAIAQQSAHADL